MRLFVPRREATGSEDPEFLPEADRRVPPAVQIARLQEERDRLQAEFRDFWLYYPDAYLEIDVFNLKVRRMNHLARNLFGVSLTDRRRGLVASQILADDPGEIISTAQVADEGRSTRTVFSTSLTNRGDLLTFCRRDGTRFEAETRAAFVVDADGHPLRLRLSIRPLDSRLLEEPEE